MLPHDGLPLTGSVRIIREIPGAPTVYIFDESHHDDPSTDENIQNALLLVTQAGADLVGVEGFIGGRLFSTFDGDYVDESVDGELHPSKSVNKYPRFAEGLRDRIKVVGVDCEGLNDQVLIDISEKIWDADRPGDHPLQASRSRHFIETLFIERSRLGRQGNLIMNCGSKHGARLEAMAANGSIDQLTGQPASYVRLRAATYPEAAE